MKIRNNKSWRSIGNNAHGHQFENYVKGACGYYSQIGIAEIEQTPEPFRTTTTNRDGTFTGRFTANAQPDFKGTLKGGRAIIFETKYTSTDKIRKNVLTANQEACLQKHYKMGALVGVCVGIKDTFAFIPWEIWNNMKETYGRQYLNVNDIEKFKVRFNGHVLFLDSPYLKEHINEC